MTDVRRWNNSGPALGLVLAAVLSAPAAADVSLPSVIGSHMVLQQDMPIKVWGWASPGERVTVELAGNTASMLANGRGEWLVTLPAKKAGGPYKMTVKGNNTLTLTDILLGEVWIGSGQSNMQFRVAGSVNAGAEIAAATYPNIRLFLVPNVLSGVPKRNVNARWTVCSPQTVPNFSAVLYFFGRHLHKELKTPVGLIASAWGGSLIEPWTPPPGFAGVEEVTNISDQVRTSQLAYLAKVEPAAAQNPRKEVVAWLKAAKNAAKNDALLPTPPPDFSLPGGHPLAGWSSPTSMYNAMIHPIVPFAARGAIWYQGESNMTEGMLYYHKKRALVEGWRKVWGQKSFSFYWAQIAPFRYGVSPDRLPLLWEAQTTAMNIPDTGMAVLTDIGNPYDIHPRNKQDVGKRLALWALAKDYSKDVVYLGPLFKSMKVDGNKIRVFFDHVGSGLESRDGQPLTWFEIAAGDDFGPATAVIDGESVVVSSDQVDKPTAIRFAWHQLADPNLQNKEGLPACPFRTSCAAPVIVGKKLFVDTSTVRMRCTETLGTIRYTLDGSEPTETSPEYTKPIRIEKTGMVRARFFRNDGAKSAVVENIFAKLRPRKADGMTLVPGLRYEYYEGRWDALPDFDKLKPTASGQVDSLTLEPRVRNDAFGFRFTGYLEVKVAGKYTFELTSNDGSRLSVDGLVVVDNDGIHYAEKKKGTVDLEPGMRKVVVTFFDNTGGEQLTVRYSRPGGTPQKLATWCEHK
ncbi:MAG: chitobiase/beta-hexosaminidase C-terminal domain-containing protein [Planctomycetota bacterium]